MKEYTCSYEAYECTHCGVTNKMWLIGEITDKDWSTDGNYRYEHGVHYEILRCTNCKNIVLVSGGWDPTIDSPDEWNGTIELPLPIDREGRLLYQQKKIDMEAMRLAVDAAKKSEDEPGAEDAKPKVGAVAVLNDRILGVAHRGQLKAGEHAEYTLLERMLSQDSLVGATIYTTLEPCVARGKGKTPCVDHLLSRKVRRVVIGMLDPDVRIRGIGILMLRNANIQVDLFPPDLMGELEEMNRMFARAAAKRAAEKSTT
ncbi:MAG: hypothetical protein H6713_03690 [Myxococcales bacterium]|nr:hypothetical protein [Myxococcales bacterium]